MTIKQTGVDNNVKELEERLMTYIEGLHEQIKLLETQIEEMKYDKPVEGNVYIGEISKADRRYLENMGVKDDVFTTDPIVRENKL